MDDVLNIKLADELPEIELAAHVPGVGEQRLSLAHYRGRPLVLFFYPKADTPG